MLFSEYQKIAMLTNTYPRVTRSDGTDVGVEILPVYPAMAMCGEIAELADKVIVGDRAQLPYLNEIGDVLWYVTAAAVDMGFTLNELASYFGVSFRTLENSLSTCTVDLRDTVLCLVVWAGEFAELVKKAWRDGTPFDRKLAKHKLSHILAELARVATLFYATLEQCAQANIDKLSSRRARGTLAGAGDNR
jgi:hypothetical protein